jgi:hypothetical protein
MIDGDCRSRSPLPNPSKDARIIVGRERKQAQESQQWRWEICLRTLKKPRKLLGNKTLL